MSDPDICGYKLPAEPRARKPRQKSIATLRKEARQAVEMSNHYAREAQEIEHEISKRQRRSN